MIRRVLKAQLDAYSAVLDGSAQRLLLVLVACAACLWFLVPVHELLHVAGCLLTGGSVTELELRPIFGGRMLARWLPWVAPRGEYAGRLSGFDPAGDLSYMVTVVLPHLLLAPLGAALCRWSVRHHRAAVFGAGAAAAFQPLMSLTGDFYEAGSIPITALAAAVGSDDTMVLRGENMLEAILQAAEIGTAAAWLVVLLAAAAGLLLCGVLLVASRGVAPRVPAAA
jgi:hypothetical protein